MKKIHGPAEHINIKFQLKPGRNIFAFVAHKNKTAPNILSLKFNNIESCLTRINPDDHKNIPCGQQKIKHKPLITFGEPTYYGQYPWHVALFELSDGQAMYICGATIISQNAVLTGSNK